MLLDLIDRCGRAATHGGAGISGDGFVDFLGATTTPRCPFLRGPPSATSGRELLVVPQPAGQFEDLAVEQVAFFLGDLLIRPLSCPHEPGCDEGWSNLSAALRISFHE